MVVSRHTMLFLARGTPQRDAREHVDETTCDGAQTAGREHRSVSARVELPKLVAHVSVLEGGVAPITLLEHVENLSTLTDPTIAGNPITTAPSSL